MNLKGQGALEYLLLIGGAVLVAAIVIALVTGVPASISPPACITECANLSVQGDVVCDAIVVADLACDNGTTGVCAWDSTNNICIYTP